MTSGSQDTPVLTRWLEANVPGAVAPFALRPLAGGKSNLTILVTDGRDRRLVLRRPPLGHVLESAHDMAREHRILSALAGTAVPVPAALALCEDLAVIGAPFYVMDYIDGAILRDEAAAEAALDVESRVRVSDALVDTLADLHAVDADTVGLGTLGRKQDYAARQLRRWKKQFDAVRRREIPAIDEVHRRLSAAIPVQHGSAIVHGDFRLDNCMIGPGGSVNAVLDWELCTLGDPLADLGLLLVYWARPDDEGPALPTGMATTLPGFRERAELVERYARRTGSDASAVAYFVALGYWKLACIFEGIHARYSAGVMGDESGDAGRFANYAVDLAEAALRASDRG